MIYFLLQNSSSHNGPLSLSDSDIEDDDSSDCSSPLTEAYIVATGNRRTKSEDELQQKIEKVLSCLCLCFSIRRGGSRDHSFLYL